MQRFMNHFGNAAIQELGAGIQLGTYVNPTGHTILIQGSIVIDVDRPTASCSVAIIEGLTQFKYEDTSSIRVLEIVQTLNTNNDSPYASHQVSAMVGPGGRFTLRMPNGTTGFGSNCSGILVPGASNIVQLRNFTLTTFVHPNPVTPPIMGPFPPP
jgi:hypothetical protein